VYCCELNNSADHPYIMIMLYIVIDCELVIVIVDY